MGTLEGYGAEVLNLLSQGVLLVDVGGTILHANVAVETLFGYEPGELIGMGVGALVPDASRGQHDTLVKNFAARRPKQRRVMGEISSLRGKCKDGGTIPIDIELVPAESGTLVLVAATDRSEETLSSGAKRDEKNLFRYAERFASIGIWTLDIPTGHFTWSDQVYAIFGLQRDSFALNLETFLALTLPNDRKQVEDALEASIATAKPFDLEYRCIHSTRDVLYVHVQGEITRGADGTALHMKGLISDISQRKSLEAQLISAQRMDAFGKLAGGIAHDFNNLLTVIRNCASMLESGSREDAFVDIDLIKTASDRAAVLTDQLLSFTRHGVMERKPVSLNQIVRQQETMLRRLLSERIELVTLPAASLPNCSVDRSHVEQVLINIVINAQEAISGNGTISISTGTRFLDDGSGQVEHVFLSIADTGSGMSNELRSKIFDPFFTTKSVGEGTGLGLATCLGIVHQLDGHIEVESKVGEGTEFRILFPSVAEARISMPAKQRVARGTGHETILVAEDSASVRSVLLRILRKNGYTVIESKNGEDALAAEARHEGAIDMLLTDSIMPRMGGRTLALEFAKRRPNAPILFVTGYSDIIDLEALDTVADILAKPFMPDELLRKMRCMMDASAATDCLVK